MDDPPRQKLPAGQTVATELPAAAQKEPGTHATQAVWPVVGRNVPAAQLAQAEAPAAEYWPGAQAPVTAEPPMQ